MKEITFIKPDDFHLHLRDGSYLSRTVADTVKRFARAIVMPNLNSPVTNVALALAYHKRISQFIPKNCNFKPLMTLYLTDKTSKEDIISAKKSGDIYACKLYPANATTHSEYGITHIKNIYSIFEIMEAIGLPLLVHGEVADNEVDIFDREKIFIDKFLSEIQKLFPELKIVLEHISTKEAVNYILETPKNIAATITAHHLMYNRNKLLTQGIKPHYYCLPILKRQSDQDALIQAAISGNAKFFLGTDSAPHAKQMKESACGCAGIYTSHAAIELYTELFDKYDALDKLALFASQNGADFYGLSKNIETITLQKKPWIVPEYLEYGDDKLIPLKAGEQIQWSIVKSNRDLA